MIDIENIVTLFELNEAAQKLLRGLCSTVLAKRRNVDYCLEYFKRYKQKGDVNHALYYAARGTELIGKGFDYNLFNRSMLSCVFYSLVGYNVSRIDNLEDITLLLFPEELQLYSDNRKGFSFKKLCSEYDDTNLVITLIPILINHKGFRNIIDLRNQMEHSLTENILSNDALHDEEHDYYVNGRFTLSGQKEHVVIFTLSLNDLLSKIEERFFSCLVGHNKDSLKTPN